ncbi:hypothetical protein BD413DRAFT_493483 [Trametes elegans]|nr:hypothetical protein BD413DRAFT_493483 [Trametes elegans]
MSNTIPLSAPPKTGSFPVGEVRPNRVRVVGLMHRKAGMTQEAFLEYWQKIHGPLFANMEITKKNILKYEQHHYNTSFNQGIAAMGFNLIEYGGLAVFEAESYEKIFEVFQSEEYKQIVLPDEPNFIDRSKTGFLIGPVVPFVDVDRA